MGGPNSVDTTQAKGSTFQISNAKLHVSVATLSINDSIRFLENL